MSEMDWAQIYAKMDERLNLKYQQLPRGEQIGKPSMNEKSRAEAVEPRKRALGFSVKQ